MSDAKKRLIDCEDTLAEQQSVVATIDAALSHHVNNGLIDDGLSRQVQGVIYMLHLHAVALANVKDDIRRAREGMEVADE